MFNVLSLLLLLLVAATTLPAQSSGIDQSSDLITVPGGGKFLRWHGHDGHSYFLQISDANNPLAKWSWAPIIEGGNDEEISYEVDGTASKGFFRLKYTDQRPGYGESLETADFDNDGIPNLDEISPPLPFSALSATDPLSADTDGDGMTDGSERTNGFDPTNPDENNNGTPDGSDDDDADGTSNAVETTLGSDPKTSSPTDKAIQTFAKKKFLVIPLTSPPYTGVSRYHVDAITDSGDVVYSEYFHPSGNPDDYNNLVLSSHRWRNGLTYSLSPGITPNRGGYYTEGGQYSGYYIPMEIPLTQEGHGSIGNVSIFGTSAIAPPTLETVVDAQNIPYLSTSFSLNGNKSALVTAPGYGFALEDGTSFAEIFQNRTYYGVSLTDPNVHSAWGYTVKQYYHWASGGTGPTVIAGAPTLDDKFIDHKYSYIHRAGGIGANAFFLTREQIDWDTKSITLRGKNGSTADLTAGGFDLYAPIETSRNGHVAERKSNGGTVYQFPGGGTETLPAAFRRNGAGYYCQVNDYGDVLTYDGLASSSAGPDILGRKFTDPASGRTSRAICRLTDSSIGAGWTGLDVHALANTMPLATQQLLASQSPAGYPPPPDQTPVPLLGGTAFKDGKQYPVLLVQVDIEEVISDQIAGIEVNKLPSPFFGGEAEQPPDPNNPCAAGKGFGNNPMSMGTRADGVAYLKMRVKMGGLSDSNIPDKLMVGMRIVSKREHPTETETRVAVKPVQYPGLTYMGFDPLMQVSTVLPRYEAVYGWDDNGDGKLQTGEVSGCFQKTPLIDSTGAPSVKDLDIADLIRIATPLHVDTCVDLLYAATIATVDFKYTEDLLASFITGDKTHVTSNSHVSETATTVMWNDLSHPVGLDFNSAGVGTTHQFNFDKDSELSEDVYAGTGLAKFIEDLGTQKLQQIIQAAPANPGQHSYYLAEIPIESSLCFPGNYQDFGVDVPTPDSRLYYSVKKAKVTGGVLLRIDRYYNDATLTTQRLEVSWDEVDATLSDVYDFANSADLLPRAGSIIQAGSLGVTPRGRPCRTIAILKTNPLPQRFLIINL